MEKETLLVHHGYLLISPPKSSPQNFYNSKKKGIKKTSVILKTIFVIDYSKK